VCPSNSGTVHCTQGSHCLCFTLEQSLCAVCSLPENGRAVTYETNGLQGHKHGKERVSVSPRLVCVCVCVCVCVYVYTLLVTLGAVQL
jgi:hypothetical protein